MHLPHPIAILKSEEYGIFQELMGRDRLEAFTASLLNPKNTMTNAIFDHRDDDYLLNILSVPTPAHISNCIGLVCPLRFSADNTPIFEVDPRLSNQLVHTDIGDKSPVSSFVLPYESMYFHFPEPVEEVSVGLDPDYNNKSRPLGGVYINTIYPDEMLWESEYGDNFRAFEVVFVSDFPESDPFDCLTLNSFLFFPDDDSVTLQDAIIKVMQDYAREGNRFVGADLEGFTDKMVNLMGHVAKCLLFITTPDALFTQNNALDDAMDRLKRVGPGKRKRFERKLAGQYNRTVISYHFGEQVDKDGEIHYIDDKLSRRPHWRRGHFRNQAHGPGRVDRKTIWVRPSLISGDGSLMRANYKLK